MNQTSDEMKERGVAGDYRPEQNQQSPHYGMFQGVANYPPGVANCPPQPQVGFPQPVRPPGLIEPGSEHLQGYQTVTGYSVNAVDDGRPERERRRYGCCRCGLGMGWLLFILGFFLGTIPWYIGAILLFCMKSIEQRERAGYIACAIAASIAIITAVILGVTANQW